MGYFKRLKLSIFLAIVINFFVMSAVLAEDYQTEKIVDYVAIGDSLAAGMTPTHTYSLGYPDYIAQKLAEDGQLNSFSNFGVAGYTTTNVANAIRSNIVFDPNRNQFLYQIQEKIKEAEIITLDAGANDILNYEIQELLTNPLLAATVSENVYYNLVDILDQIESLNPDAKVYVMGYYNPFPFLTDIQPQLEALLAYFNLKISQAAENNEAFFVPTNMIFPKHTAVYLPEKDIHPSQQGYQAIAKEFWSLIK